MNSVSVNSGIWVGVYTHTHTHTHIHVVVYILPIPFTTKMHVVASLYLYVLKLCTLGTGAMQIVVLKFLNNLTVNLV